MARPFLAPDPKDRSVNEPSVVVSSNQVLGFYNQETNDKKERVVESVQKWYVDEMKKREWTSAEFHGNQCLLVANISLNKSK